MTIADQLESPLDREEYVEQAHFFQVLGERMAENVPAMEVLASVREEVLATTKLPLAIDFLCGGAAASGGIRRRHAEAGPLLYPLSVLRDGGGGKRSPPV